MNLRDINKKNLIYYINRKFARVNKKNIQDEQIYSVKHEKNLRNTQT